MGLKFDWSSVLPFLWISIVVLFFHSAVVITGKIIISQVNWKMVRQCLFMRRVTRTDQSNFRPITLEPILSKVMTSNVRNKIFTFVVENNYVETNTQRGFWSNISGTIEHTELLTNVLKHVKNKQQQLVVTLFDLKNTVGEAHHNLIKTVLKYHHIPPSIINLINSLYPDYFISITTKHFITKSIKSKKVGCLGYVLDKILSPRHWFQFANNTAIITTSEGHNQLLCNVLTKWTS